LGQAKISSGGEEIDDALDGGVGALIGGFEAAIGAVVRLRSGSGTELGVRLAIGYIKGLEKWRQADDGGEVDGLGREEAC